ncbi:M28 family peptidase [Geoalkalibacter halelectricus]|uniref:M28 family peptidase n=1 Tax=Geoalkalibacter halelectricus TaxID=2847045 RepID=UPI00266EFC56|nr:M28 family peptidase [Geoalkalibacter halelectricus]
MRSDRSKSILALGGLVLCLTLGLVPEGMAQSGDTPARTADAPKTSSPEDAAMTQRLQAHVEHLAGTIGERNMWRYAQLQAAAAYIEEQFTAAGCAPTAQTYEVHDQPVSNLIAEIPGNERAGEIVVIGAHYDSVLGSPGANDNASGVAALLELARRFCEQPQARTLRLIAFVNEEPPFFKTPQMGSRVYAEAARARGDRITAMVSLETIGYYSEREGSQRFPLPPLRFLYPTRGNFLAFVANLRSRGLLKEALEAFRAAEVLPAEGLVAPGWLVGVDWSDHWSFWRVGYPAIMVTDTALFRYPHYHSPSDTPDKVDYPALTRVTLGLEAMVMKLCRD